MSFHDGVGLVDRIPALVYARALDATWTLHQVSGGGAALLGRTADDLGPGSSLIAAVHADDRERAHRELQAARDDYRLEYRIIGDGFERWVIDRGRKRGGQLVGVIVELGQDDAAHREQRAQLEARLWEAQKLEAVGRLAGGVAHDFNNTLTGIIGHAALIKSKLPAGSELLSAVSTIEHAAARAAKLTQQLLGFARKGKYQDVVFDLANVVDEALALLERSLDRGVKLVRHPPAAVPVCGDPAQIQGVVLDLAINARDALPNGGGTITFSVRRAELDHAAVAGQPGAEPGSYAVLVVEDDGAGVPPEVRELIFEPFFTTKPRGTGMGLAMAYGVVKNHGGFITLDSVPGRGSAFAVHLPEAKARRSESTEILASSARSARVLLVDDEEFVRYTVSAQIKALGHEVLVAHDGEEAVAMYRRERVDVVILDLTMPRMDGAACFRALRVLDPGVRVILSSGFGRDEAVQGLLDEGIQGFLEKPFRQADLAAEIARLL